MSVAAFLCEISVVLFAFLFCLWLTQAVSDPAHCVSVYT